MKFVQIATAAYVNVDGESYTPLYALGDDGSVWELVHSGRSSKWRCSAAIWIGSRIARQCAP